jgi:hypothetical protein
MQHARQTISIPATEEIAQQVQVVRDHYDNAITAHKVLTRAAELGLELLACDPGKLAKVTP